MEGTHYYDNDVDDKKDSQSCTPEKSNEITDEPVSEKHGRRRSGRSGRRGGKSCSCKPRRKRSRGRKLHLSRNPFIIFYLEMYFQKPCQSVVEVARRAGKKWCSMSDKHKEKYIRLAERMQRRCGSKRRKH